jgi:hypothetical protein
MKVEEYGINKLLELINLLKPSIKSQDKLKSAVL